MEVFYLMKRCVLLDPEAEAVCEQSAVPPLIFQLPPTQGRNVLEDAQNTPVCMFPAEISRLHMSTRGWGEIPLFVVTPKPPAQLRHVILYLHGGGWVFGSFHTHEKLIRELSARTHSLILFPEYTRSPEAKYPVAMEQCYYLLSHMYGLLQSWNPAFCSLPLTVAGDSAGGNLAIAMAFLSRQREGPCIERELLYYPVTNACFDTVSYRQFASGYYLYRAGMQWFWQQYTTCAADQKQITASPLLADDEDLKDFPRTMIVGGQADVLRSEGELFAKKLRCAGVSVTSLRVQGTIHDFVMLHALDSSNACRVAMDATVGWMDR